MNLSALPIFHLSIRFDPKQSHRRIANCFCLFIFFVFLTEGMYFENRIELYNQQQQRKRETMNWTQLDFRAQIIISLGIFGLDASSRFQLVLLHGNFCALMV